MIERIQALEQRVSELASQLSESQSRQLGSTNVRLIRSVQNGTDPYPTLGQNFPFVFRDGGFTLATGAGTDPTLVNRANDISICSNLAGSLPPQDQDMLAWFWRERWWTIWNAGTTSATIGGYIIAPGAFQVNLPLVPGGANIDNGLTNVAASEGWGDHGVSVDYGTDEITLQPGLYAVSVRDSIQVDPDSYIEWRTQLLGLYNCSYMGLNNRGNTISLTDTRTSTGLIALSSATTATSVQIEPVGGNNTALHSMDAIWFTRLRTTL